MRAYRLVLLVLILMVGCKTSVPTSSINYSENLSVHRPELKSTLKPADSVVQKTQIYVPLTGHLKNELDSIAKISLELNKAGRMVDGFSIQFYSGGSSDVATDVWHKAITLYPELDPKRGYRQPNFRVRAGKFIDRLEANRIYKKVQVDFPRALLIPERFKIVYD